MKVFLILLSIFFLVGIWLSAYSGRMSRLVKTFGDAMGLSYTTREDGALEETLNSAFTLPAPLGRGFSRIRDIVEGDGIRLFRLTKSLDVGQ
jgi:hypothetical protein